MDGQMILSLVSIGIEVLLAVGLYYVGAKANQVTDLRKALEIKAESLVDQKFSAVAGRMDLSIAKFEDAISRIEKRLERGDETFGAQAEQAHHLDKKITDAKAELKEWTNERFALANDMHVALKAIGDVRVELATLKAVRQVARDYKPSKN